MSGAVDAASTRWHGSRLVVAAGGHTHSVPAADAAS